LFYEDWPELRTNGLYVSGGSYGGIYAPRLAYAVHVHNQESILRGMTPINLKGFIVANGAIDYRHDPHVSAVEMLTHFGISPLHLLEEYNRLQCHVEWIWFYFEFMKPLPSLEC